MHNLDLTTEEIKDLREAIITKQGHLVLDLKYVNAFAIRKYANAAEATNANAVEATSILTERSRLDKLFAKLAVYP